MSQKAKKPRLDRSDDSDYSDQEISIHASYEDEFTIASPRFGEHRGDTGTPMKHRTLDTSRLRRCIKNALYIVAMIVVNIMLVVDR